MPSYVIAYYVHSTGNEKRYFQVKFDCFLFFVTKFIKYSLTTLCYYMYGF